MEGLALRLVQGLLNSLDFLVAVGLFWGVGWLAHRRLTRQGMPPGVLADAQFWAGVGALVLGRLFHLAPQGFLLLRYPLDFLQVNGGLSLYGAMAGALLGGAWVLRRARLPLAPVADGWALFAPLGISLYRLSCLGTGTCFGNPGPPPLAVRFPGLVGPRYPSELYEGLLALLLFGLLARLAERGPRPGTLTLAFLGGYGLVRALVDLTRIRLGSAWGASDVLLSLAVAGMAGALWLALRPRRARAQPDGSGGAG